MLPVVEHHKEEQCIQEGQNDGMCYFQWGGSTLNRGLKQMNASVMRTFQIDGCFFK